MSLPACDVVIPTEALRERGELLREAVRSVLEQEGVRARPIVVINGPAADPALQRELDANPQVLVERRAEASLPGAHRRGRELVSAPWFGALDDDDVLLPDALATRIAALMARPELDVVVSNGFREAAGERVLQVPDPAVVRADPLGAMLRSNWLLPGSWLCRTERVGPELFDSMPKYLECTYLGLRFASRYRMEFLELPTVVWRTGTPRSMSKSRAFALGQVAALESLLRLELPRRVRAELKRHLVDAHHARAVLLLREGAWGAAWRDHLRSLRDWRTWRYLGFTRALLWPPVRDSSA